MSQALRTTITMVVLCVLLLFGAVWGWHATTQSFPAKADSPICVDTTIKAGEKVYPQQVTVNVYNAGQREGLAGRTMQLFTDAGFAAGISGNAASAKVTDAAVWTDDPTSPAALLVASRLGPGVQVEKHATADPGITVVVGDDFGKLVKGRAAVRADSDTQICSPPVD